MPKVTVGLRAKEAFTGNGSMTKTFTNTMNSFVLYNDGAADISITVNNSTFTVKPSEIFDEFLEPYTQVTITNSGASPFRAYGRG